MIERVRSMRAHGAHGASCATLIALNWSGYGRLEVLSPSRGVCSKGHREHQDLALISPSKQWRSFMHIPATIGCGWEGGEAGGAGDV